jgi:hypothetical protein
MNPDELKSRVSELVQQLEVYSRLPKSDPVSEIFLHELRWNAQKLYEEINRVPSGEDKNELWDRVIRGFIESGLIKFAVQVLADVLS